MMLAVFGADIAGSDVHDQTEWYLCPAWPAVLHAVTRLRRVLCGAAGLACPDDSLEAHQR